MCVPVGMICHFQTAVSYKLDWSSTLRACTNQLKAVQNAATVQEDVHKGTHLCIIRMHKVMLTQKYRIGISLLA
jgi:hypothetical protein